MRDHPDNARSHSNKNLNETCNKINDFYIIVAEAVIRGDIKM